MRNQKAAVDSPGTPPEGIAGVAGELEEPVAPPPDGCKQFRISGIFFLQDRIAVREGKQEVADLKNASLIGL